MSSLSVERALSLLVLDCYLAAIVEGSAHALIRIPSPCNIHVLSTAAAAVQHSMQYKSLPPSMQQALQHKIYDAILVSGYTVS